MDLWLFDLPDLPDHSWVSTSPASFPHLTLARLSFSVFVPQLATLPVDNSTSEWDNVKYLIDHFDSSRKSSHRQLSIRSQNSHAHGLGVEDSISFAIFTLSIIGFFLLTIYTVSTADTRPSVDELTDVRRATVPSRFHSRWFAASAAHVSSKHRSKNNAPRFRTKSER